MTFTKGFGTPAYGYPVVPERLRVDVSEIPNDTLTKSDVILLLDECPVHSIPWPSLSERLLYKKEFWNSSRSSSINSQTHIHPHPQLVRLLLSSWELSTTVPRLLPNALKPLEQLPSASLNFTPLRCCSYIWTHRALRPTSPSSPTSSSNLSTETSFCLKKMIHTGVSMWLAAHLCTTQPFTFSLVSCRWSVVMVLLRLTNLSCLLPQLSTPLRWSTIHMNPSHPWSLSSTYVVNDAKPKHSVGEGGSPRRTFWPRMPAKLTSLNLC